MTLFEKIEKIKSLISSLMDKGRLAERNAFWEVLQKKGSAGGVNYYYAFAYNRFSDDNFNPQFPIICSSGTTPSQYMFFNAINITDTKVHIKLGSNAQCTFAKMEKLTTIRSLESSASTTFTNTFSECPKLENILSWSGEIGQTISFPNSPLSKASIEVVFSALSDSSSGKKVTFKQSAVLSAFTSIESSDWLTLLNGKPNWTVSIA